MMKHIAKITTVFILITGLFSFAGCSKKAETVKENAVSSPQINKGITVNKITFEEIKDADVPSDLKEKVEQFKEKKGFLYSKEGDYYYVAVLSGTKNTGGYRIKVLRVEDNEGKTNIEVEETSPEPGQMVIQAITYPHAVIRMKGITENFSIKNTKGESFNLLK